MPTTATARQRGARPARASGASAACGVVDDDARARLGGPGGERGDGAAARRPRRRSRGRRRARRHGATNRPPRSGLARVGDDGPVDDDVAGRRRRRDDATAGDPRDLGERQRDHAAPSPALGAAPRQLGPVVERVHDPADLLARSRGPCPRRRRRPPGPRGATASRDGGRAVRLDHHVVPAARPAPPRRPRASPRGSPRGSSERGLSSVTTATSATSAAAAPIGGRLSRSRSPPQPSDDDEPARCVGRSARQRGSDRVGGVRVVDDARGRLPRPSTRSIRPGTCGSAARRRRRPRARSPSSTRAATRASAALVTLKRPGRRDLRWSVDRRARSAGRRPGRPRSTCDPPVRVGRRGRDVVHRDAARSQRAGGPTRRRRRRRPAGPVPG